MNYELNGKSITREKLLTKVKESYLTYIETIAHNLFYCGCYEYVDMVGNQTITITE